MKIEKILSHKPKVLSDAQRNAYFKDGYLVLDRFISDEWLDRLWAVTNEFIDESRTEGIILSVAPSLVPSSPHFFLL